MSLMSIITAAIVLSMQANITVSLGMVGALSIVRFRTAIKEPKDLLFLFWKSVWLRSRKEIFHTVGNKTCTVRSKSLFSADYLHNGLHFAKHICRNNDIRILYRNKTN